MASSKTDKLRLLLSDDEMPQNIQDSAIEPSTHVQPTPPNSHIPDDSQQKPLVDPLVNDLGGQVIGSSADRSKTFCPLHAISRFPYKFMRGKAEAKVVASHFFDNNAFWNRCWDVYYVWPIHDGGLLTPKALFLIPTEQVEAFFQQINEVLEDVSLTVLRKGPDETDDEDLRLSFDFDHPRLRPRFLGRSFNNTQVTSLERNVPGDRYRPLAEMNHDDRLDEDMVKVFKRKVGRGAELCSNRKSTKAQRYKQRATKQQLWKSALKHVESFLGLRPPEEAKLTRSDMRPYPGQEHTELMWEEWQAKEEAKIAPKPIPAIDPALPPPYPFDSEPVIICVDVECYERDRRKITEIGISTLDTLTLKDTPPGENAVNWFNKIQSRHFRIRENAHLINGDFCEDNSSRFHREFGKSEFISLSDAPREIGKCFRPPYPETTSPSDPPILEEQPAAKRSLVIAGHDIANDLRFLQQLGYDASNLSNRHKTHPTIDTQSLHRALHRQHDSPRLSTLLRELRIDACALHNAGNDAAYTLRALLALAVKSATQRGSPEAKLEWEERRDARTAEAAGTAAGRTGAEYAGWSSDEDDEEGGMALGGA